MKSKPSKRPRIQVRGHFVEPANDNVAAHRTYRYHVHIEDQDNHHSQDYDRSLYIKNAAPLAHISTVEEAPDTHDPVAEETTALPLDSEINHEAPAGEDAAEKMEQALPAKHQTPPIGPDTGKGEKPHTAFTPDADVIEQIEEVLPAKEQAPPVGLDAGMEQEPDTSAVPAEDSVAETEAALQEETQALPEPVIAVIHDEPEEEAATDDAVEPIEYHEPPDEDELEGISEQAEADEPLPMTPFGAGAANRRPHIQQKFKQWLSVKPIAMLLGVLLLSYLIYVVYKAGTSVSHRLPGIATGPAGNQALNGKQQTIAIPLNPGRQGLPVQPPIDEPGEAYTVVQQQEVIHIVVRGDTLWFIAKRYVNNPLRYPELARLSKIKNPDLIYPGDRVRIFVEK